jgi:hypothetical protein
MPPPYRFGDGDITDAKGSKSGQVEVVVVVVVEYPFLPSLPMVGSQSRLYLAEGVAAVIEVKSNISSQWGEVEKTAAAVKKLDRNFGATFSMGEVPGPKIPFFAVGYTGLARLDTLKAKLQNQNIDGILVIDKGLFISGSSFHEITVEGSPWALWGLIQCMHPAASVLKAASASPLDYAM